MEATAGLLEVQVPPSEVEENVELCPTQSSFAPLNVPALGALVTVIDRVSKSSGQPPEPATV